MGSNLVALLGAVLSGSVLRDVTGFIWRRVRSDPKADAEARKLNVQADGDIATRLWAEIERLDRDLKTVRTELDSVRAAAIDEKRTLENENKQLRTQVGRLRKRIEGLEKVLKIKPITPDMQRLLDALPSDSEDGE